MMKVSATFSAKRLADGSTLLRCRETGTAYSFHDCEAFFPIWRGAEIACYRRSRNGALAFIESDARWQIREEQRIERLEAKGAKTGYAEIWL